MKIVLAVIAGVLILGGGLGVVAARQGATLVAQQRHVGATVKPYAFNTAGVNRADQAIPAQIEQMGELNATIVRMNVEGETATNDTLINAAHEAGLDVLLVLERGGEYSVDNPARNLAGLEQMGYDFGYEMASRYRGKVKFYQLANEVSGATVNQPGDTGPTFTGSYDQVYNLGKYERIQAYTNGLSKGVRAADPDAKRVITGHWILIDVIKKLIDGGVDFEIVGWDWYSDMGVNPGKLKLEGKPTIDLPGIMNGWGKEFWLVELNKDGGSHDNTEAEQAEYLSAVVKLMETDQRIRGSIVHMLTDIVYDQERGDKIGWLGIVKAKRQGQDWVLGESKPAFTALSPLFARINAQTAPTGIWDQFALASYEWLQALKAR